MSPRLSSRTARCAGVCPSVSSCSACPWLGPSFRLVWVFRSATWLKVGLRGGLRSNATAHTTPPATPSEYGICGRAGARPSRLAPCPIARLLGGLHCPLLLQRVEVAEPVTDLGQEFDHRASHRVTRCLYSGWGEMPITTDYNGLLDENYRTLHFWCLPARRGI